MVRVSVQYVSVCDMCFWFIFGFIAADAMSICVCVFFRQAMTCVFGDVGGRVKGREGKTL